MRGADLTEKQLTAAEKYLLMRRSAGNTLTPSGGQLVSLRWTEIIMLLAEYGAIRAASVEHGGSANEPGEVYLTGKV